MDNHSKLKSTFCEIFELEINQFEDAFSKENATNWDSIRQLSLVSKIEDDFDVFFEPEQMLEITSYYKAIEILTDLGIQF